VTELGDPKYIGTALTLQTCLGFLLTTISIELIPRVEKLVGWRYAFVILRRDHCLAYWRCGDCAACRRRKRLRMDGGSLEFRLQAAG